MINSHRIEDLDARVQPVALAHIAACEALGIEIIVTSTYRDFEQQDALYLIGRQPGDVRKKVTNAKAGESWHNFRTSWDVVPVVLGKCVWDDESLWQKVIEAGESVGAEAGANWKTFKDRPHFQFKPAGLKLETALPFFKKYGTVFV